MVFTKSIKNHQIIASVRRFTRHVESLGFPIRHALLFGSWAKGTARADSDIDICLVSPKFGKDEIEEMQFLLYETDKIDDRIEPVPLSVDDFEHDATPLVLEIKKYGQRIL